MEKIAVLGPKGTFSEQALLKINNNNQFEPVFYNTINDCFHALDDNINYCVIPIENTLDGYVQQTLDLLLNTNYKIIEEIFIPVQFSLVSNAKDINSINKVFVQFKAKNQCLNFINTLKDVKYYITESNIESYDLVSNNDEAAIIPSHVDSSKDFTFRIDNITDSINNQTRFVVITKKKYNIDKNKMLKSSLWVLTKGYDKPGLLYSILGKLSNFDLISIMSRPTKEEFGKYNFFIELIINNNFDEYINVLEELRTVHDISINDLGEYLNKNYK